MKTEEWKQIKYRGKPVSNIKQHKVHANKFLIDFRKNKKRHRKIISVFDDGSNTNMIQRAIKQRDEMIENASDNINHEVSQMNVDTYFERYITSRAKANKWSEKYLDDTRRAYRLYIKEIIGKKKVIGIKSHHITDIMDGVAHLSLRSQKLVMEILQPLFNKAVQDDKIIQTSPIQSSHLVKRNPKEEKKVIVDAVEKYKLVYHSIHKLFKDDPRNRALLLFGFYGRRKMEVLKMRWEDVNLKTKQYIVRAENSKANTSMIFTLPEDIIIALQELQEITDPTGYIFESPTKRGHHITKVDTPIMKLRDATGIQDLTYHWFRNLAVSALSAMGVESIHLSSLLGHTDINTVNKYLSLQREASSQHTNEAAAKLLATEDISISLIDK